LKTQNTDLQIQYDLALQKIPTSLKLPISNEQFNIQSLPKYQIFLKSNPQFCFDVFYGRKEEGMRLIVYSSHGLLPQQFCFQNCYIICACSDLVLDVKEGGDEYSPDIVQRKLRIHSSTQQWTLFDSGLIKNKNGQVIRLWEDLAGPRALLTVAEPKCDQFDTWVLKSL
jgi:hypothetical protein